jgi:hypothetical protein
VIWLKKQGFRPCSIVGADLDSECRIKTNTMRKIFIALSLVCITLTLIAITGSSREMANALTANSWKFKSVISEDRSASDYLTTIYEGTHYNFAADNSFTGSFFELSVSGTWSVLNDTLYLNKGTDKQEIYTFTFSHEKELVLTGTEKGSKVHMSFVKDK